VGPGSGKQFGAVVEEATIDCYDEAEQGSGFVTLMDRFWAMGAHGT
jgi:hypothetical protein